jgi:hypothetical protein
MCLEGIQNTSGTQNLRVLVSLPRPDCGVPQLDILLRIMRCMGLQHPPGLWPGICSVFEQGNEMFLGFLKHYNSSIPIPPCVFEFL